MFICLFECAVHLCSGYLYFKIKCTASFCHSDVSLYLFKYCSGLEIIDDAARCFNCGSYNHSLRECQRPRDNTAVSNARKQRKSRRNQNSSSRNPTRYYQNSPAGKYAGLRPGALDDATRQLLGLEVSFETAVLMFLLKYISNLHHIRQPFL